MENLDPVGRSQDIPDVFKKIISICSENFKGARK